MWDHIGVTEQLTIHRLVEALTSKDFLPEHLLLADMGLPLFCPVVDTTGKVTVFVLLPGFAASPHFCSTDGRTSPCQEFAAGSTSSWLQNHIWCFKVGNTGSVAAQFEIIFLRSCLSKVFSWKCGVMEEMLPFMQWSTVWLAGQSHSPSIHARDRQCSWPC